jgi:hypothetical protein
VKAAVGPLMCTKELCLVKDTLFVVPLVAVYDPIGILRKAEVKLSTVIGALESACLKYLLIVPINEVKYSLLYRLGGKGSTGAV